MAFYLLQEDGNKIALEDLGGFIILEEELIAPTLFHQGDGKTRRRRRRTRTAELFDAMEQTLRRVLAGEVDAPTIQVAQVGPTAVVLDTTEDLAASVSQLTKLARGLQARAQALTGLFTAFQAYEQAKREAAMMDDEEVWMLV